MMKRFFIIAGILISAILLFLLTFAVILPSNLIELWLKNRLEKKTGLVFAVEGFQKSPPFGFKIERISIFQDGIKNPLFTLDKVQGRLSPLDIFSGGIKLFINSSAGGGRLEGVVFLKMYDTSLDIKANNISLPYLDSIPELVDPELVGPELVGPELVGPELVGPELVGPELVDPELVGPELVGPELVEGLNGIFFNGEAHAVFPDNGCPAGIIKAEGKDMQAVKIKVMGFDVPLGEIKQTGIMMEMKGCKLLLKGLWVEGKTLSARLQGEISLAAPVKDSPVNMTLEIIPKQPLMENELLLSFIKDYRKSANYYSIPIKGTVESPVLVR